MFPKSARHPSVEAQSAHWSVLCRHIDVHDSTRLSDLPELAGMERRVESKFEIESSQQIGEVVGANAIRSLAKSYECLDAMARCASDGINLSAMTEGYNASVLAARGFCMLMGFSPLDRSSPITVDAFPDGSVKMQGLGRLTAVALLHRFRRWGHDEVWNLTARLVDTVKVPDRLDNDRIWLRRAKLSESSRPRNVFHYDDSAFSPSMDHRFIDFPDIVSDRILDDEAPVSSNHQVFVAVHILRLCMDVLCDSRLIDLLSLVVCDRRRRILDAAAERTLY